MWVHLDHILMVKRATPSIGTDKISREYVVTLSKELEPDQKFSRIWLSADEAEELLNWLERKEGEKVL